MAAEDDLRIIAEQEKRLVFDSFDEDRAFRLGSTMRDIGLAGGHGITVDIRLWNRPMFLCALPGSNGQNSEWARRKINVVGRYLKSTYRLVLEMKRPDATLAPEQNLPLSEFVLAGGGFPITVKGAGVVGAIAISGLPQREDHVLVVRALCDHLGVDESGLSLPPQ